MRSLATSPSAIMPDADPPTISLERRRRALEKQIEEALRIASLAPSSHNCQPWKVLKRRCEKPSSNAVLQIGLDKSRIIDSLESLQREMYMSLGGFAAALVNLLHFQGLRVDVDFSQTDRSADKASKEAFLPLLTLKVERDLSVASIDGFRDLSRLMQQRSTIRSPYTTPASQSLNNGGALAFRLSKNPCDYQSLRWSQTADARRVNRLGKLMRDYGVRDFSHVRAWSETYQYIDFSSRSGKIDDVGFNIQQLTGPLNPIQRWCYKLALSPTFMPITKWVGWPNEIAGQIADLIEGSSMVYLSIATTQPTAKQFLLAGEMMLDYWLCVTQDEVALHPTSVLIQHNDIKKRLQRALKEPDNILFLARTGKVGTMAAEPEFRYRKPLATFYQY